MKKIAFTIFAAALCMSAVLTVSAQDVAEQTRQVSGFNAIASGGPFQVHITMGNTESLKLKVDADLIDKVETVVEDGTLKVRIKRSEQSFWNNRSVTHADVFINAKSLSSLVNAGSGTMEVDGEIKADDFKAVLSGSGAINTSIKTGELHVTLSGSGSVSLKGSANSTDITISGSGQIKGKELTTETAAIVISGSGNVYLKANKQLNASLIGSGSVYYSGSAQTDSRKIGSGRVTRVE